MSYLPPSEQDTLRPGAQLRVEVHSGPLAGKGYPFLSNSLTMGRAPDNDIVLDDAQVSRYHAILQRQGSEITIQDLDSTNGVLVNGERIFGPHVLQPTETITIGSSVLGVTGFPAPSTVSMSAQGASAEGQENWNTYQSGYPYAPDAGQSSSNWLLWAGLILLLVLILAIVGISVILFQNRQNIPPETILPSVVISSPVAGSQFNAGQRIIVQATATDVAEGIVRLELWVGGQKQAESISPVPSGQSPFTANMEWSPQIAGDYTLEVLAFNTRGVRSAPTVVNVTVLSIDGIPTDTSTPTLGPVEGGNPVSTVQTDLNVRTGPGTQYAVIGLLSAGTVVDIAGRNEDTSWWYIVYDPAPDRRGWISAAFAPSNNATGVPIVNTPPPPPTETPTPTPTTTDEPTPTSTTIPTPTPTSSATPTATPSPTTTSTSSPEPNILFSANPTQINEGQCTTFTWLVTNVKAVFFEEQGVVGDNNGQPVTREECPTESKTYTLRVITLADQEVIEQEAIIVNRRPGAPTNLQVTAVTTTSISLSWQHNGENEDGFRAYNAAVEQVLAEFPRDATGGTISNLTCNITYTLYLVAYNQVGLSERSNTIEQALACP